MIIISTAHAQTVINYEDGSTYTLKDGEKIYISKNQLFNKPTATRVKEWSNRDHVPYNGPTLCWEWGGVAPPPGYSYEACQKEEPEECNPNGLTFGGSGC